MKQIEFPFNEIETFTFDIKPQPLPANLRPIYRISLIAMVLKLNCHGGTASSLKLQFFNWALKSPFLQKLIEESQPEQEIFTLDLIHLDPMVNLALKYAFSDNLISVTNSSKYKLTGKGDRFVEKILNKETLTLSKERDLLLRIGKKVSEVKLRSKLL